MLVLLLPALPKWCLVGGQLACAIPFIFSVLLIIVVDILWIIGVLYDLSLRVTTTLVADWLGMYPLLVRRYLGRLWFSALWELIGLLGLMLCICSLRIVIPVILVLDVRLLLPLILEWLLVGRNSVRLEFAAGDLLSFIAMAVELLWQSWTNVLLSTASSDCSSTRAHKLLLKWRGLSLLMELLLSPVLLLLLIAHYHWWRFLSPLLFSIVRGNVASLMFSCTGVDYLSATCGWATCMLLEPGWLNGFFRGTGRYILWGLRWIVSTESWFLEFWSWKFLARRDYILCGWLAWDNFVNNILSSKIALRFLGNILLVHFPRSCLLYQTLWHFFIFFIFQFLLILTSALYLWLILVADLLLLHQIYLLVLTLCADTLLICLYYLNFFEKDILNLWFYIN